MMHRWVGVFLVEVWLQFGQDEQGEILIEYDMVIGAPQRALMCSEPLKVFLRFQRCLCASRFWRWFGMFSFIARSVSQPSL